MDIAQSVECVSVCMYACVCVCVCEKVMII